MKRFLAALFAVSLVALAPLAQASEERPVLRSQVMTLSEIVTVGDFYSNAGLLSTVPLFRSPDMGTSGNVPADFVAERARNAGLANAGTDGLRTVVVHRGATKVNRSQLEGIIRNTLAERSAGIDADTLELRFTSAPDQIIADPKVSDPIRIDHVDWNQQTGHFTVMANVAGQYGNETVHIAGNATEMIDVLALAQPVSRGTIIREGDLTTVRLPKSKAISSALLNSDDLIGLAARVSLRAFQPVARKDFERPVLVSRGDKVTVTFEVAGMKLTSRAQALDSGAKGDVVDVMNVQSRRIVPAVIVSRGQVRVHAANPIVASLNSETN